MVRHGLPKYALQGPWEALSGVLLCLKEGFVSSNTSVPLTLEPFSAVLARVAYELIRRDFRDSPHLYIEPSEGLGRLSRRLYHSGWSVMSVWVAAYAYHNGQGMSTSAYRQWLIQRARWAAMNREYGRPWARVPYM